MFSGSNTDGSFTTAVSNSFLSPLENIPWLQIWDKLGWFSCLYWKWYIVCTHKIRLNEAILMRTHKIPSYYEKSKYTLIMPPDLALWLTFVSSNYPSLEHIFVVPKVFEPLKFLCIKHQFKIACKVFLNLKLDPASVKTHYYWKKTNIYFRFTKTGATVTSRSGDKSCNSNT